jgi:hypothetical protein
MKRRGYIPETAAGAFARMPKVASGCKADKPGAVIGNVVRVCPGGRHAWCESDCGVVRKAVAK